MAIAKSNFLEVLTVDLGEKERSNRKFDPSNEFSKLPGSFVSLSSDSNSPVLFPCIFNGRVRIREE
jgi:hypothetical protein